MSKEHQDKFKLGDLQEKIFNCIKTPPFKKSYYYNYNNVNNYINFLEYLLTKLDDTSLEQIIESAPNDDQGIMFILKSVIDIEEIEKIVKDFIDNYDYKYLVKINKHPNHIRNKAVVIQEDEVNDGSSSLLQELLDVNGVLNNTLATVSN